jgi:glycosyltransferase involved in cell wall biosynthesis
MSAQNKEYNLSYVIVTFNKLPYLKETLETVITNKQDDEEIVIIDGGSTDSTPNHLQKLHSLGKIEQFVSEKDKGQSHAINKGMLLARGKLIKILNDDDVYFFNEIQKCKHFMLDHRDVDALGSNGIQHDGKEYHREEDFMQWKKTHRPFQIAEQGMVFRRDSIPIFGLADSASRFWEGDFTLRLTSGKSKLAWYTGITWKHVFNEDSISVNDGNGWIVESAALRRRYPGLYSKWRHHVPKPIRTLIRRFFPKKLLTTPEQSDVSKPVFMY